MCTVSYLPTTNGFILTSNRDEAPDRHAVSVHTDTIRDIPVTFPRDPQAGGTWFAMGDNGFIACLLNGAFETFKHSTTHAHSRGIVLLDSFRFEDLEVFADTYDFQNTAPFTLVLIRSGTVSQIIWDGRNVHSTVLDPGRPHFWSSVTLYPEDVRAWRKSLFDNWHRQQTAFAQENIIDFHKYGSGDDPKNGFVMNRDEVVRTLSISSVEQRGRQLHFRYLDLQDEGNDYSKSFDIQTDFASHA